MSETTTATPAEQPEPEQILPPYIEFATSIGKSALHRDDISRYEIDAVRSKRIEDEKVLLHATDARQMAFVVARGNAEHDYIHGDIAKKGNHVQLIGGRWVSSSGEWAHELCGPDQKDLPSPKAISQNVNSVSDMPYRTTITLDAKRLLNLAKSICNDGHSVTLFIGGRDEPIGVMASDPESPKGIGILMPIFDQDDETADKRNRERELKVWAEVSELAKRHYGESGE